MRAYTPKDDVQAKSYYTDRYYVSPQVPKSEVETDAVFAADLEAIKAKFEVKRILEIEETTKHDVIAFLTNVAEYVGPESRHIHYGMTSSDILDTCLSYQMKTAGELLLSDLKRFSEVLKKRALEHKNTICVGRSHGIHAEPTTMGLKFALWFDLLCVLSSWRETRGFPAIGRGTNAKPNHNSFWS